jgi:hypothetical protein
LNSIDPDLGTRLMTRQITGSLGKNDLSPIPGKDETKHR